jgi:hypothetical protein
MQTNPDAGAAADAAPAVFPLLVLPDLTLQHVLGSLSPLERKALRLACRKLWKVTSAAVRRFVVELTAAADDEQRAGAPSSVYAYLRLHERFPNVQVTRLGCVGAMRARVCLLLCVDGAAPLGTASFFLPAQTPKSPPDTPNTT